MRDIIPIVNIDSVNIRDVNIRKLEELTSHEYKALSAYLIGKTPASQLLDGDELTLFNKELTHHMEVKAINVGFAL